MSEGELFGGIFGGDEEGQEHGGAAAGIEAVAFSAALAADHAKYDPQVARATEAFLEEQTLILKVQREEIVEQRVMRLSHLNSQAIEGRLRRLGQRLRLGMQALIALIALIVCAGLLTMVYDAFTSRSVVINAFKAPAGLAAQGLTGDVVAAGVLDTLQKLQDATRGVDKGLDTRGAWASDIKLEVPETGISIGEIDRLLHDRFGQDLHIDGDLVQTQAGGLALTIRGDGMPASTFTGAAADIATLTAQAADYVYGRSQPARYGVYLTGAGRFTDALAFLPGAFARAAGGNDLLRAKLANAWGTVYLGLNKPALAAAKYRLSMALTPRWSKGWWAAFSNLILTAAATAGEEAGWRESQAFLKAVAAATTGDQPAKGPISNAASIIWDYPLSLDALLQDAALNGGSGAMATIDGPSIADLYALVHDPAHASQYLAASDPDDSSTKLEDLILQGYAALDRGEATAAVESLAAFYKAWLADPDQQSVVTDQPCYTGLAYGLAGRLADAEAVFSRIGPWSRCYAFHGDVLAHAGDTEGAQRVWADGLKILPDLPVIYLHRGLFELSRNDLTAAAADFATANAHAPHFADPLKAWGDLLARQKNWPAAIAKYDEALQYAPAWAELQQARDAAKRANN